MERRFEGKVIVITGAAGGIGRATAERFGQEGAAVVAVDLPGTPLGDTVSLVEAAGSDAIAVPADVSRSADVQRYVQAAKDRFGGIDCFFNNAGIEGRVCPIHEYDEAVFDAVIGVNVKGVFLGLKHVLPVMIAQGSGSIVNTASTAGFVGNPGIAPYCASKHAVIGLTKAVSGEVARQGIRVNAVCPGPVDTRMIHSLEEQRDPADPAGVGRRYQGAIPIGRYATVEEIAATVMFLSSDLASAITGAQYLVDGGRTATGGTMSTVVARTNG